MNVKDFLKRSKIVIKLIEYLEICIYYLTHIKYQLVSLLFSFCKLQNKVVCNNFQGRGYGCNPKYIANEIRRQNLPIDIVWLVNDLNDEMAEGIRKVKFMGLKSYYELATAKVIINNVKGDLNFRKRKGQLYIQTWHSTWGPKICEKAAKNKLPKAYICESKNNSKVTDIFIADSKIFAKEIRENFWVTKDSKILETGIPRTDIFFNIDQNKIKDIKSKLKIDEKEKIILFAPTFRGDTDSVDGYGLDYKRVLDFLNKEGNSWKLLIRLHPNVKNNNLEIQNDNILNVSSYPDMQELLLISDILITDVSSIMTEFLTMEKPIFLFATDWKEYENLRGYKEEFFTLPFVRTSSSDELIEALQTYEKSKYIDEVKKLKEKYCTYDQGVSSKNLVKEIVKFMKL